MVKLAGTCHIILIASKICEVSEVVPDTTNLVMDKLRLTGQNVG
jgi:hypothetical protein